MSYVLVRRPGPAPPCAPRRAWRARSAAHACDPAPVPLWVSRLGSSPVLCSHALHPGYVVPGSAWHAPPPGLHAAAALQDACTAHTTAACQASERACGRRAAARTPACRPCPRRAGHRAGRARAQADARQAPARAPGILPHHPAGQRALADRHARQRRGHDPGPCPLHQRCP